MQLRSSWRRIRSFPVHNSTADDRYPVLMPRPFLDLETKTETWVFRSRDRDRDLDKMNSSALESRDDGLEITLRLLMSPKKPPPHRNVKTCPSFWLDVKHKKAILFISFHIIYLYQATRALNTHTHTHIQKHQHHTENRKKIKRKKQATICNTTE